MSDVLMKGSNREKDATGAGRNPELSLRVHFGMQ